MLTPGWTVVLVVGLEMAFSPAMPAELAMQPDSERIGQLVSQLGSLQYKEREAATQALDAIGLPALETLRKASQQHDPEVSRRAEKLVQKISKRQETVQLLEPKRVHLVCKDLSVSDAVRLFAQKTGFPIQLTGARSGLWNRKVTLDTGETSFWEAFDQFCDKAGLSDRVTPQPPPEEPQQPRVWQGGRNGVRVLTIRQYLDAAEAISNNSISLMDGKVDTLPTYHAGAVRVRAVPSRGNFYPRNSQEALFMLEVTPEPKLPWQSLLGLHIDKAVDDQGQKLTHLVDTTLDGNLRSMVMGNNMVVLDSETGRPLSDQRELPVRLQAGPKPAQLLKEVRGVVTAQVQTPVQPLLTVDQIAQAAGQTVKGSEGHTLKVQEVSPLPNGGLKLKLQFEDPAHIMAAIGGRMRRIAVMRGNRVIVRNVIGRGGMVQQDTYNGGDNSWTVIDVQGRSHHLALRSQSQSMSATGITQELEMLYQPGDSQAEALKLVYSGRRAVILDIPFTLKDVPLAKPAPRDAPRARPSIEGDWGGIRKR